MVPDFPKPGTVVSTGWNYCIHWVEPSYPLGGTIVSKVWNQCIQSVDIKFPLSGITGDALPRSYRPAT